MEKRLKNQPYEFPNSGSTFKNVNFNEFDHNIWNEENLMIIEFQNQKYIPAG